MKNNKGFTLLEMLLVILIIGILSGLATYSVNVVFNGNTKSYASQFASAVKDIKVKTLSSASGVTKWCIKLGYDTAEERYFWCTAIKGSDGSIETKEMVYLKKDVAVHSQGNDLKKADSDIVVSFSNGVGEIASGAGTYQFINQITNKQINVNLVQATGGIFIED